MVSKAVRVQNVLDSASASILKARIYDLSESGAKQALYGMVQVLTLRESIRRDFFEECLGDAAKYAALKGGK